MRPPQRIEPWAMLVRKIAIWSMVVLILGSFISAELVEINSNSNSSGGDQGDTLLLGLMIKEHVALTDGTRNPLYPALISVFAQRDLRYFTCAKFASLALGILALLAVFLLGRRLYSDGPALVAMFLLSINSEFRWAASSVLAEVLLVLAFFMTWYFTAKGFEQWHYWVVAGFCGGLAYLTKSTGQLLLIAFLISIAIVYRTKILTKRAILVFPLFYLIAASVLLIYNVRVYGSPTFNYPTALTMWVDEWEDVYSLQSSPTLSTYLRTHTLQEIIGREWTGMQGMAHVFANVLLTLEPSFARHFFGAPLVLASAISLAVGFTAFSRERVRSYWEGRRGEIIFTVVLIALFYLTFAWYAQALADSRFVLPLVPMIYVFVAGFACELVSHLAAQLQGNIRTGLILGTYAFFCVLALSIIGSDLTVFRIVNPFRNDILNNVDQMNVMMWLEQHVDGGTVIAYHPGHDLPLWMYATLLQDSASLLPSYHPSRILPTWMHGGQYDFIGVPYKASWETMDSYLQEQGTGYIIFNRELLARRKPLFGHFLYRKGSMRMAVLALPSSWDLALAYGGLPCQYCIFRLNWPEPGEADEVWQHARLGDAYRSQGEVMQAIAEYESALALGGENWPGLHVALGRSYQAVELLDEAVEEYEKAIELRPEEPWYHALLGEVCLGQGRAEEAMAAYMEALALSAEGWPSVHQALGQVYEALGKPEEAIAEYEEAIRLEPDDAGHHKLLGDLYRFQEEMEKAAVEYEKVIELDGHHWPDLHVALGQAYEALGRLDEAQAEYGKAGLGHIGPTQFGDSILLLGYGIDDSQVASEGKVEVNLYWQCLQTIREEYIVYLKLINPAYHIWGQEDSNLTPPINPWRRGTIVKDTHQLTVLPATPPGTYSIEIILWDPDRQQNLEAVSGEPLLLGPLEIPPRESLSIESLDIAHPMRVNLGDKVSLLGYTLESGFRAGDGIHLTLFWQCLEDMERSYVVFTHLVDPGGNIVAQKDSLPVDGFYPTMKWEVGEIVRDQYDLLISPEAQPGEYQLEIGMYLVETGQRLAVFSEETHSPVGDKVVLGTIQVQLR